MTATRIKLPWDRPPLHANQRLHRHAEARIIAEVRRDVGWLAKAHLEPVEHLTVGLVYAPGDRRRRDGGENLAPLIKACIDGIVDAGIVPDDTPQYVTRLMPVIEPPPAERGMWLTVASGSGATAPVAPADGRSASAGRFPPARVHARLSGALRAISGGTG